MNVVVWRWRFRADPELVAHALGTVHEVVTTMLAALRRAFQQIAAALTAALKPLLVWFATFQRHRHAGLRRMHSTYHIRARARTRRQRR